MEENETLPDDQQGHTPTLPTESPREQLSAVYQANLLDILSNGSKFVVIKEPGYWPAELDYLNNRYSIRDNSGQRILHVGESIQKPCCFPLMFRPFILLLLNGNFQIVGAIQRRWTARLCFWGAECGGNEICLVAGSGPSDEEIVGQIEQHTKRISCGPARNQYIVIDGASGDSIRAIEWWNEARQSEQREVQAHAVIPHFGVDIELIDGNSGQVIQEDFIIQPYGMGDHERFVRDIGMRVPGDLSPRFKALLLGLLLSIYVTNYDRAGLVMLGPWRRFHYKGRIGCIGYKVTMWTISIALFFGIMWILWTCIL